MLVIQVIDTLKLGGAERVAVDIANLLYSKNINVKLIVLKSEGELKFQISKNIDVIYLPYRNKFNPLFWFYLYKSLKNSNIIHVHMRHNYGKIKILSYFTKLKSKIIFHDHFGDIHFNKKVPFYLKNYMVPKYYIGVSNELLIWAKSKLKINSDNSFILPNTIFRDPNFKKLKVSPEKRMICVSNLRPTKNLELAIKIANNSNIKLDIVGQVINDEYYGKLKKIANNKIQFITNCSDIFNILHEYDLAIHTTFSETGPLVILEYLKFGLNFLTFDTGEVTKKIANELPFSIVKSHELDEWEKKLSNLFLNPYSNKKLHQVYEDNFGVNNYYEKLMQIYESVLKK